MALSPKKNDDKHNYVESITSFNKGHPPENEWRDMKFFHYFGYVFFSNTMFVFFDFFNVKG